MPEWKDTVNLPRTEFPMKASLPRTEPETLARWAAMDLYGKIQAKRRGFAQVRAARRPAVRQRQHPHGHGAQQDPEGFRRQVAIDGRLRRAVRARIRLSRPADRAAGGPRARPEEARDVGRRFLPRVPRVRRALRRHDERAVSAARHSRQLGGPLPDDGLPLSGGDRARARPVRRAGAGLQGQEAGPLVHPLPHRARRSRGRVRGSHVAVDLRRVSAGAVEPERARRARAGPRRPRCLGPHLDDDAVDDSVEPGRRVSSGARLRGIRRGRTRRHRRRSAGANRGPGGRPRLRSAGRPHEGRRVRGRALPASHLRPRLPWRPRRVRDARRGHGRGAYGAGPRRRRLQHRREIWARDLRADRTGRTLPRHGRTVRRSARVRREPEGRGGAQGARPALASRVVLPPVPALLALPQPGHLPRDVPVVHRSRRGPPEGGHDD